MDPGLRRDDGVRESRYIRPDMALRFLLAFLILIVVSRRKGWDGDDDDLDDLLDL